MTQNHSSAATSSCLTYLDTNAHKNTNDAAKKDLEEKTPQCKLKTVPVFLQSLEHVSGMVFSKILHRSVNSTVSLYRSSDKHTKRSFDVMSTLRLTSDVEERNAAGYDTEKNEIPCGYANGNLSGLPDIGSEATSSKLFLRAPGCRWHPSLRKDSRARNNFCSEATVSPLQAHEDKHRAVFTSCNTGHNYLCEDRAKGVFLSCCHERLNDVNYGCAQTGDICGCVLTKIVGCRETVVVKKIQKSRCTPLQLFRCYREVEILQHLRHPNLIKILYFHDGEEELFLVLEHAQFGDLYRWTNFRWLPEATVKRLAYQVLQATVMLHDHGIIHGDIKPNNMLLFDALTDEALSENQCDQLSCECFNTANLTSCEDADGMKSGNLDYLRQSSSLDWDNVMVKLCDFEFARYTDAGGTAIFSDVSGSHGFIAPEILLHLDYCPKADVWAIGSLVFRLLCGYEPFYPTSQCLAVPLEFDDRYWGSISHKAKDFISRTLCRDSSQRLTSREALYHTWLSE